MNTSARASPGRKPTAGPRSPPSTARCSTRWETETALSNYARLLERRTALQAARDEAGKAARITRAQQREDQIDSLAQLDAGRTFADAEATLALADAQIARAQIDLFRALGGNWSSL